VVLATKSTRPGILQMMQNIFGTRFPIKIYANRKVLPLVFTCKSKVLDHKGVNVGITCTGQMSANFSWVWKQNSRQVLSKVAQQDVE
jgi:hypothetical protein